jgi:hypothetical protein
MPTADELIDLLNAETAAALTDTRFRLEGFRDDNRLNIREDTRQFVQGGIERYADRERRLVAVEAAVGQLQTAIRLLRDHGYPDPIFIEMTEDAIADIDGQLATQHAARDRIRRPAPPEATGGRIELTDDV